MPHFLSRLIARLSGKFNPTAAPDAASFRTGQHMADTSFTYKRAAKLLSHRFHGVELTIPEARVIVSLMKPKRYAKGETIIAEGDSGGDNSFMFMVLDGEVAVESSLIYRDNTLTVAVFGPGTLVGEMGLISNQPRSATCVATTPVAIAILHRSSFYQLLETYPKIAAKLLMLISCRISDNLRQTSEKIKLYSRLVETLQTELDGAMPTPKHIQTNHLNAQPRPSHKPTSGYPEAQNAQTDSDSEFDSNF